MEVPMKFKLFITTVVLGMAPGLAMAACSGYGHEDIVMSCPQGQTFDVTSGLCMPTVNS
jgi:hypothetical protein